MKLCVKHKINYLKYNYYNFSATLNFFLTAEYR